MGTINDKASTDKPTIEPLLSFGRQKKQKPSANLAIS